MSSLIFDDYIFLYEYGLVRMCMTVFSLSSREMVGTPFYVQSGAERMLKAYINYT